MSEVSQKQLEANRPNTKNGSVKPKKDKAIIKKPEDTAIEKMTIEEAKDFINRISYMDDDPKRIMEKLSKDLLPQIKDGNDNEKVIKETTEIAYKAMMVYGLDTHYPLVETVGKKYRPLVIEFSRQLIQEHSCQASDEKALAQVIVNAYARIIEYSQFLNTCRKIDNLTNERIAYYSMISKELDRANRQFITALTTLKQIKTPSLEINVKTKAAFVAQNQQLNINPNKAGVLLKHPLTYKIGCRQCLNLEYRKRKYKGMIEGKKLLDN